MKKKCDDCYKYITADWGGKEENEVLLPFRLMMCRVALRLNSLNWDGILQTADDFVVTATDYTGYWTRKDMEASIPSERMTLLKRRKLAFP